MASVTSMNGFEVIVFPEKLILKVQNGKLSFKLSVEGLSLMKERSFWLSTLGGHKKQGGNQESYSGHKP